MKKLIIKIVTAYHKFTLKQDLKIAIDAAKELRYKNHKKHLVLYLNGGFRIFEKQQLKELIRKGGYFKKGVSFKHIEQNAYYITD